MLVSERQLTSEQSRKVSTTIREEIARRRISRLELAERARISISTLEKALAGRRPFTLATTIRLEEALGVTLRNGGNGHADSVSANGIAPDDLGAYARRSVLWIEGTYLTLRPSFGEPGALYAYRTDIVWDDSQSSLIFRESERLDSDFTQYGSVAVPNQSGHIYLVTNRHGQFRLITVSRPTITGEMHGILTTLLAGRGSQLTPIAAPIAFVPLQSIPDAGFGRIASDHALHDRYQLLLRRTLDEPFAMFLPVA
ncbi:helix-turn-helix domain-containing protein [Pseudorhodoplanes sp.]|uniref:helix-turn-helix domain-containing protein n=1 Tax=Pseudorhodoplanes sp. TaxID=1934341 RepID=UPI003D11C73A